MALKSDIKRMLVWMWTVDANCVSILVAFYKMGVSFCLDTIPGHRNNKQGLQWPYSNPRNHKGTNTQDQSCWFNLPIQTTTTTTARLQDHLYTSFLKSDKLRLTFQQLPFFASSKAFDIFNCHFLHVISKSQKFHTFLRFGIFLS